MKSKNMSEEKYTAEDSYQNLEEWEDYGFDSKEEYEEYTQKCAEDSLYGYSDLLTMKELRALLKKEPYKPKDDDAKYPDHLLINEKAYDSIHTESRYGGGEHRRLFCSCRGDDR